MVFVQILKKHISKDLEEEIKDGFIFGTIDFAREVISKYLNKESTGYIKKEKFAGRPGLISRIIGKMKKSKNKT